MLISFGGAAFFFAHPIFAQANEGITHPIPSGADAAAAAAAAEEERKDPEYGSVKKSKERFTYGKHRGKETVATKESTNAIQKTKDGSSDVTVSTGVFKDSLLDADLPVEHVRAKPTPTPSERVNPLRSARTDAKPAASALPGASPAALTTAPLDITLGVKPAAIATPTPRPN